MPRLRTLALVLALTAIAGVPLSAAATVQQRSSTRMHGQRYCEYLVVRGKLPKLTADVWNTYGLNKCPAKQWNASDAGALAKSLGALTVALNGPRYWLVNSATVTLPRGFGQVRKFPAGLRMRRIATLDVPVHNGVPGNTPYTEVVVNRRNSFTWSKRYPVYELTAPSGRTYVMQSFARIRDPHLSLGDLHALGARLRLPAGWRFRERRLRHDLTLTVTRRAIVVQDELQDTYQLVTRAR